MIGRTVLARRYARALFDLAQEAQATERWLAELTEFTQMARDNPELERVLFTPLYPREERRKVLRELAQRLSLAPELRSFLLILVDENRTVLLPSICDAVRTLWDRSIGRVEAVVCSARPLTPEQEDSIRSALSARISAEVNLRTEVDPELIGGVVARVGDLLFDGSVKTQLASLADSLRKGAV